MKKIILSCLLLLPVTVFAEVSWTDDSGTWYTSRSMAVSMAKTNAHNSANDACEKMDGREKYGTDTYDSPSCNTKVGFQGRTDWKCSIRASIECLSR